MTELAHDKMQNKTKQNKNNNQKNKTKKNNNNPTIMPVTIYLWIMYI